MPQSPRRNSQTQTNWADQLSANRYAAGAVVALLAAYVVAGRGEPPSSPSARPTRTRASHRTANSGLASMTTRRRSCATGASGSWPCGKSARPPPKASNYN